ncbi:MAG: transcription-repair coupling factor [Oscillospiraceae bacterium]|jgi:transcription-repair coupling factor (superfamily II helicase)|nr:transcription-repair coupling factor [Oscillospiraceae bacterium]
MPQPNGFSALWRETPEFQTLQRDIAQRRLPLGVLGLSPVHKAHLVAALLQESPQGRTAVLVAPDEMQAARLTADLREFGLRATLFPARDLALRPAEVRSREYEHQRLAALAALDSGETDIVLCSMEAALQRTIPLAVLRRSRFSLRAGEEIGTDEMIRRLLRAGYVRSAQVDGQGQFALRGGILDVFPPGSAAPLRAEFWGDQIDALAWFDPESQRRLDPVEEVDILPANEIVPESRDALREALERFREGVRGKGATKIRASLQEDIDLLRGGAYPASIDRCLPLIYAEEVTLLDYLPEGGLLFVSESFAVRERAKACEQLWLEDAKGLLEEGVITAGLDRFSLRWPEWLRQAEARGAVYLDNLPRGSFDTPVRDLISVTARQLSPWNGALSQLTEDLDHLRGRSNARCVILAGAEKPARLLAEDLEGEGIPALYCPLVPMEFPRGRVAVLPGTLSAGAEYPQEKCTVIAFGARAASGAKSRVKKTAAKDAFHSLSELKPGDYVVHRTHGIGIFEGIVRLEAGGTEKDYIHIRYNKGDVLYLPVTQLDQVSKYIGPRSEGAVKLNRLGGRDWQKTRSRVSLAVKDLAKELTALYAKRLQLPGFAFSPDIDMQNDFERRFEFEETQDQLRCIAEIKQDMEQPYPMDRLLCGDVGFGKTEVALRAAFKCVADGKQCALLVPTTILAYQHYQTIQRRFEGFPIEAAMLSRFVPPRETKAVLKRLERGNVDIVVGTHRLISSDVKFRDLGLIIVDEEQRFGVAQKEKLKELYPNVDVLTLTATPIPRTLNMAMSGIRDMSVLEEAPQDRFPVQTYVLEHNLEVLAQAISAELRRSGQVYYLHNRVESIERTAGRIRELLPDAAVEFAHGQMSEDELSQIWRRQLEGEIDVLVCTTIIETGIDVPNVNTLIIEDADRMGLAQLHQIRGRVGRSTRRASAYLTFRRGKELSEISTQRLNAIREYTEFGAGFQIAMRDLELRGAGSLLGAQQHGHLEAVGYDLYMELLQEAIRAERGEEPRQSAPVRECLIDLPIDANIPPSYMEAVPHRLAMYRRIADIRSQEDADDVLDELIDRFGEPPAPVMGLVQISLLRAMASRCGIFEIGRSESRLALYIERLEMPRIQAAAKALPGRVSVSSAGRPHIAVKTAAGESPLAPLQKVLSAMQGMETG